MGQTKKPLKIDPVLVCLGKAVELRTDTAVYKWRIKDQMLLYASCDGKKLFILKPDRKQVTNEDFQQRVASHKAHLKKGETLYQNWHKCEPTTGSLLKPPRGFLFGAGRVLSIIYSSDKWTGKKVRYIHDFKKPPVLWVSSTKAPPRALVMTGGKIQVKKEGITG